jgi:hypothetical protein
MTAEELTKWNGNGYWAIVLAADVNSQKPAQKASSIYKYVGASPESLNRSTLASEAELDSATFLMKECIFCVVKSLHDDFPVFEDFTRENENYKHVKEGLKKIEENGAPVPVIANLGDDAFYNNLLKVRKIRIDGKGDIDVTNPTMLLGKAVSNVFKLHGSKILPGCGAEIIEKHMTVPQNLMPRESSPKSNHPDGNESKLRPALREIFCHPNFDDDNSVLTM